MPGSVHALLERPQRCGFGDQGALHLIEQWAFTWGASYQKRGEAERWTNASAETKEIRTIDYEGNLEFFVEKVLGSRYVIRLAAQNLLDAKLTEVERVYESVDQIQAGTPIPVVHTIELLDWACGGPVPRGLERFKGAVTDVPEPVSAR